MWEYKRFSEEGNDVSLIIKKINDLGKEGWEVISINEDVSTNRRKTYKVTSFLRRKIEDKKELLNG